MQTEIDNDKIIRAYLNLRKAKEDLAAEYKEKDAQLKEKMEKLENHFLRILNETNTQSIRTDTGIVYRQEDVIPTGADWNAFYDWVAENNAFDFLERRIKKSAVAEYMETHGGGIPPGVSVFRKFTVRFRKA